MKAKEMRDYLDTFDPEAEVCVVAVDIHNRTKYDVEHVVGITDSPVPFFGIEIGGSEPFDQELINAAEEDERKAVSGCTH